MSKRKWKREYESSRIAEYRQMLQKQAAELERLRELHNDEWKVDRIVAQQGARFVLQLMNMRTGNFKVVALKIIDGEVYPADWTGKDGNKNDHD